MKTVFLIVSVYLLCITINAQQDYKFEFEDKCGTPVIESQIYAHRQGKVLKINKDNTIQVKDRTGKKWIVKLAGVETTQKKDEVQQILANKLLGQRVEFIGNPEKEISKNIEAIVMLGVFEVNRYLLEKGLSRFSDTDYGYSVSNYKLCVYTQLEEIAQKTKLGIWTK